MKKIKGEELAGKELEVLEDGTLRLIEKPMKFIPSTGEEYWYVHNLGGIERTLNDGADEDYWLMRQQLVFKTKEECEEYKEFLKLLDDYKFDLDWENEDKEKFYLYYNYLSECLNIGSHSFAQTQGVFYFISRKDVEEFIEKAGEDNIKRFMFDVWE